MALKKKRKSLGDVIAEAIGAKPGDTIVVRRPQFTRPKSEPRASAPPVDAASFDALKILSDTALKEMGLQKWGRRNGGPMLWLFPGEWYNAIPNGYQIVTINYEFRPFIRGVTDNDIRFGCLAYGFLKVKE